MKLWQKLLVLLWIVVLIHLLWGAAIILQGGTLEEAKTATHPLGIVIFLLGIISGLALIKGDGEFFKPDERTLKLSGVAFRYSWIGMTMTVAALIGIDAFYPTKLTVPLVLWMMGAAVLIIPFALLQYFERKGDAK
ncbi:MAG: hypothetical protein O8C66_13285 [Candidatus Methanoperedens sp.]|nr:hypothetical protein [Candidatus Methanoperedens sp.]MCZ7371471.1 hypothetical protein [Candidatus Methanoperedens sp.]